MLKKDNNSASPYSSEVIDEANDHLQNGDPFDYIVNVWNQIHVGDRNIGETCACSVGSTYISNTYGLHQKPSGTSGKGKTDAMRSFLTLLPAHKYLIGSLSGKTLYYNDKLLAGMIVYTDDSNHNEDVVTMIKTSTSAYQTETEHHTVKNQTYAKYTLPPRLSWWMTSVDGFDDDQMSNRFLGMDVDESKAQDIRVSEKQQVQGLTGMTQFDTSHDATVCQCIYDILSEKLYNIVCPFSLDIVWHNTENRRNLLMFHDIIKSVTLYHIHQREQYNGSYLSTVEDFERAKSIYKSLAENNATNLTSDELKIMRYLSGPNVRRADIYEISKAIGKAHTTTRYKMHGRDGSGGLLAKVPGLRIIDRTEMNDDTSDRKTYYSYDGSYGLSSYSDIVSLSEFDEQETFEEFKIIHSNPELFT